MLIRISLGRIPILLGLLCSLTSFPAVAQSTPGSVIFSELMWPGSSSSSADEWIELYNRGVEPVELTGWTITRGSGEDEVVMLVLSGGTILPGEVFLISNYSESDERSLLARAPDLVDAAVSLPNSRLHLHLYDGDPESGHLIDEADDGSGAPLAGVGGDSKASMIRVSLDMVGSAADAWSTATAAEGWDPGVSELGTPGTGPEGPAPIASSRTQVSAVSWARLKSSRQ